jgi:SNF2 family DNA or RNA helicase
MILLESDLEHRVVRKDKQGNKWEYSDKIGQPSGDGWGRVDQKKHPRATKYLWVRPYSRTTAELRQTTRKPSFDKPTDLVSIDPRLVPSLDIEVGNAINEFRNQLRKQFEYEKNPFLAGDRVRLDGKEGVFYVKGVDPVRKRLVVVSATNNRVTHSISHDEAKIDDERGPMPWYFGDTVKIAAGAIDSAATEGEVVGYDNHTNKVRVQIGTNSFEVYPESIVGLRGQNGKILETAQKHLEENSSSFSSPDAKKILESLLRASLDGRTQVKVQELIDDVFATTGTRLTPGQARGTMMALSSLFKSGKDESIFYNPMLDNLNIERGKLPLRLVCNMRQIKNTHKSFGWKNITAENSTETYARVGLKVKLPEGTTDPDGRLVREGRVRKVDGNKIEVAYGGTTKMMYMGDVKDLANRSILPDPTDPAAFGSINKSAFWLLRDREWVRDYKPGDIVSVTQMLQDPSGDKMGAGEFGKVIDVTTDGRLLVKTNKGAKISVSPRQVRQNRKVANLQQLHDKVRYDTSSVYGTMTIVGDNPREQARIGVGDEQKHKFVEFNFDNGAAYRRVEQELFAAVVDNRATMNQTRAIMAMDESIEDRESKTLVPNKQMLDIIRRLYPSAETFMITRDLKRFPKASGGVAGGPRPTEPGALTQAMQSPILDTQPAGRKTTKQYEDHYEPANLNAGWLYDEKVGEFRPAPDAERRSVGKWDFLNPFGDDIPANTRIFSPQEMDYMQSHTPVSLKILINPTPADMKARHGVVHEIPAVLRQFSDWKNPMNRPKGAYNLEDLDWNKRIKISSDGTNVYVSLGKELMSQTSSKFTAPNGQPLTLHQLITMPIAHKYTAWQEKYPKDVFSEMLLQSSLLTYDRVNKRYQTRLNHYDEVHDFLHEFFGDTYQSNAFEDVDGSHCFGVMDRKLAPMAREFTAAQNLSLYKTPETGHKPVVDGFAFKFMGYTGPGATPNDKANWVERDYQRDTMDFLLHNPKTLLANDQGTGKSGTMLGAFMGRVNQGQVKKALIVAPASLVTTSWPDEIKFWLRDQALIDEIEKNKNMDPETRAIALKNIPTSVDYALLTSRTKEDFFREIFQTGDKPLLGIASYEMAVQHAKELQRAGFDMVMLDEAQNIKTGETDKRSGSLRAQTIKDMFVDVEYKIAATGTPVENSAEDLHSIVSWLDPNLLGEAPQFMQDFVETDYVDTADGKRPVSVAIKNPWDLHARLNGVFKRYSKDYLREREQTKIKELLADKGETFDAYLHYGAIAPRAVYPLVKLDANGMLTYEKAQRPHEHAIDPDLSTPLDLANPSSVDPKKYGAYLRAVSEANKHYASLYAGVAKMKTKYGGTINTKASAMLTRMQQVLIDPAILSRDPAFANNPLFNDPNMPNPKYDRLVSILDEHDRKPLNIDFRALEYNPLDAKGKKSNRERALRTRGKTIIFCQTVEAMKSLQRRLENDPKFAGRAVFYAGTQSIGELSGKGGAGKAQQKAVYNKFKHDPNVDILIANDAAQTGLSIPQADLVVNYEMNWNPQAMNQRIDRAHRMGKGASNQHRPVTAINLVTARSVEEKKVRAHAFRNKLFDALVNTEEKVQTNKQARARQVLMNTHAAGTGIAASLHGENHAAIMEDIIRDNPELRDISAMSEHRIAQDQMARKAANKSPARRTPGTQRKLGLVSKLFGWA